MTQRELLEWAFAISISVSMMSLAGLLTVGVARVAKSWIGEILK